MYLNVDSVLEEKFMRRATVYCNATPRPASTLDSRLPIISTVRDSSPFPQYPSGIGVVQTRDAKEEFPKPGGGGDLSIGAIRRARRHEAIDLSSGGRARIRMVPRYP